LILFTADWHIKLGQKNVPKQWALNRYRSFFDQVYALENKCSRHIIGGDIFDRVPSLEELELYFEFISGVNIPTVIYDGNHEATRKNKTFFSHLKKATNRLNSLCEIIDTSTTGFDYSILPYCDLHKKGSIEAMDTSRPLFTHVRGEIPPHVKPEVDLERFKDFPIVFAGDLHAHSNTQLNIVYPGSPMTTSFHRSEVQTGYILIHFLGETEWLWKPFELPQLIRKTVQDAADMIATPYHHTIYELEGDMQDLANTKNSDLLDKKVVKRNTEAALILDPEMTIQDELIEYLTYILELDESKVQDIVGVYNDYT
jgi:DNA repair exonuclease SbcCD nuclease subunit